MSRSGHYTDSGPLGNSEHHENLPPRAWREDTDWQRLGVVVDALKRTLEDAIARRDDHAGDEAHADLICAEWRLRQAERRRP